MFGQNDSRSTIRLALTAAMVAVAVAGCRAVVMDSHRPLGWALALAGLVGATDCLQRRSALRRNYPLIGRGFEWLTTPSPFNPLAAIWLSLVPHPPFGRRVWTTVRQRADGRSDLASFGGAPAVEAGPALLYSMTPIEPADVESRVQFGCPRAALPYGAALLNVSALSFGAISETALRALSAGAKGAGCYCNSGEGGLHPALLAGGGDIVWQLGSAYFGCRTPGGRFDPRLFAKTATLPAVKMIELKLSQGAKPGHGGVLPASKVSRAVAEVCGIPRAQDSLCPATHPEFSTPVEMLAFVDRLRDLSGGKPVGIKLAIGRLTDLMALTRAMIETAIVPDYIAVDGGEGGSGAAPAEFMGQLARPFLEAVWLTHNVLRAAGLRDCVRIVGSGRIALGADMVRAFALGADVCAGARAFMLALGCIQAMSCQTGRCPTGIATQNRYLSGGLAPTTKAAAVTRYQAATVESCAALMAAMGRRRSRDLTPQDLHLPAGLLDRWPPEAEGALLRGEARSRELQDAWAASDRPLDLPFRSEFSRRVADGNESSRTRSKTDTRP